MEVVKCLLGFIWDHPLVVGWAILLVAFLAVSRRMYPYRDLFFWVVLAGGIIIILSPLLPGDAGELLRTYGFGHFHNRVSSECFGCVLADQTDKTATSRATARGAPKLSLPVGNH